MSGYSKGKMYLLRTMGVCLLFVFIWLSSQLFSMKKLFHETIALFTHPFIVMLMVCIYALSFILRAFAWYLYMEKRASYKSCLISLGYSLFLNHLLPIKVGDAVRIGYVAKKARHVNLDVIIHSVIVMRVLDIGILLLFSSAGFYFLFGNYLNISISFSYLFLIIFLLIGTLVVKNFYPTFFRKHIQMLRFALLGRYGALILLLIASSWVCEAIVIFEVMSSLSKQITFGQAVWTNSLTVSGQIFQVTPGGIATYETIMAFALAQFKIPWQDTYTMAIVSHGFKFIFSYMVGILVLVTTPIPLHQLKHWIKTKGVRSK
jgi:uncharacterized membrane protein YbhN (UPF0104 family)